MRLHPDTVMIPEEDARRMEDFVNLVRQAKPTTTSRKKQRTASNDDNDDGYEAGLRVPTSVLNECEGSFVAADERREKASTQFFDDTGLMALLCRHDRPLWLVNMRSAGGKTTLHPRAH